VFISEIFPNRVRARGQALGSFTHWIMAAAISWTFPIIAAQSGGHIFAFYACAWWPVGMGLVYHARDQRHLAGADPEAPGHRIGFRLLWACFRSCQCAQFGFRGVLVALRAAKLVGENNAVDSRSGVVREDREAKPMVSERSRTSRCWWVRVGLLRPTGA